MPHPFNKSKDGAMKLNYSPWEYENAQQTKGFKAFEAFIGNLNVFMKGKRIAELACGGGGKSVYFVENGAESVDGCDLSSIFIDQANAFAQEKGVGSKCKFIVGDATKTPYKDSHYDIVIMASILEHVSDPEGVLREALRICKPGGKILYNTEGYYHWLGHHLWDALAIPWLHLFTSEKQRIRLYKKAVEKFPDAQDRIELRIGKDSKGRENFDYLNHITLKKLDRILNKLEKEHAFSKIWRKTNTFRKKPFAWFGKMPFLREIFHESEYGVIER